MQTESKHYERKWLNLKVNFQKHYNKGQHREWTCFQIGAQFVKNVFLSLYCVQK